MAERTNIFLIGPMGAGKTSIGKQLAKLTHREFYDSDHELQRRTGTNLSWIYELEKEEGLRKREHDVLRDLVKKENIVLSTGGGSVVIEKNRALLKKYGVVIYLQASIDKQKRRTRHHKDNRPLLDTKNPHDRIIELHHLRVPLYEALADITYETNDCAPSHLAKQIFNDLKSRGIV